MTPIFSYYGGKQRLVSRLLPLIPNHSVYLEPFCGGATVLFCKPPVFPGNSDYYREIINDTNADIYNFYKQMRDNGPDLCRMIELTLYHEKEYKEAVTLYKSGLGSPLDRAHAFYVNIQMGFANKLNAGWRRSVNSRNEAQTWANKVDKIRDYIPRLKYVHISCTDALTCLKQFSSPQSFAYCDPPYPDTNQGHYSGYTKADFAALVDVLDQFQGSFLLSCYDFEGIKVPENWERYEFKTVMSAARKGSKDRSVMPDDDNAGDIDRVEIVYRRIAGAKIRDDLKHLVAGQQTTIFDYMGGK